MKIRVDIINHTNKGLELLEYLEFEKERFTARNFKTMVRELFFFAGQSYRYAFLTARIKCGNIHLVSIKCDTITSPDGIRSHISVAKPGGKFMPIRTMLVCEC